MTTHELAKKLLEGPDVPVVSERQCGYGETEVTELVAAERKTMWQVQIGSTWREDFEIADPSGEGWPTRSVEVVEVL